MITWDGTGGRSQSFLAGKGKGKKPASGGTGKGDEEPEDNTMVMRQTCDQSMHWRREANVCGLCCCCRCCSCVLTFFSGDLKTLTRQRSMSVCQGSPTLTST